MSKPGIAWYDAKVMGAHGRKGGKRNVSKYMIEGDTVTYEQMAERLGCTPGQACNRLCREQKKDGLVTWKALER